jgi:hypothetical protein
LHNLHTAAAGATSAASAAVTADTTPFHKFCSFLYNTPRREHSIHARSPLETYCRISVVQIRLDILPEIRA